MDKNKFKRVKIEEATRPENGIFHIYCNYWWVVTESDEILYYKGSYPQCNISKSIVESLMDRIPYGDNCTIQKIPVVYQLVNPRDY